MKRVLFFCLIFISINSSFAMHAFTNPYNLAEGENQLAYSATASLGYMDGTSYERVYNNADKKISELIWDIENVLMLGASGSINFNDFVYVNFGLWSKINSGTGEMDDYDWQKDTTTEWTDWSHSEVDVDTLSIFDLNIAIRAWGWESGFFLVKGGYKQLDIGFTDYGGNYIYSNKKDPASFRDYTGSFNGVTGIVYEQSFSSLYFGAELFQEFTSAISAQLYGIYAPSVSATDYDEHKLRNIVFDGTFQGGKMYQVGLLANYKLSEEILFSTDFQYQKYSEFKGDVLTNDGTAISLYRDGGSVEHNSMMVEFKFGYMW